MIRWIGTTRNRLLFAIAAALLILAGCSDDSSSDAPNTGDDSTDDSGDDTSDESDAGDDAPDTGDDSTGDAPDTGDTPDAEGIPSDALEIDPIGVSEQITTMIEDAGADGDVTGEEIGEILEVSGTPEGQATCEGDLLAELGVTDPTDPEQLAEAALSMTEDQRIALSVCMGGG